MWELLSVTGNSLQLQINLFFRQKSCGIASISGAAVFN